MDVSEVESGIARIGNMYGIAGVTKSCRQREKLKVMVDAMAAEVSSFRNRLRYMSMTTPPQPNKQTPWLRHCRRQGQALP